jgi:hypothetical protein
MFELLFAASEKRIWPEGFRVDEERLIFGV